MLGRLKRYLDKKGFELNVGKTKVRCRKGGGRGSKINWRKWKGRAIEEVREFNYLWYLIKYNGKQEC